MATPAVLRLPTISITATPPLPPLQPRPARRRTTPQQGRALEVLGHAIEYLVDSRLVEGGPNVAENRAIRMLMGCSRTVFEEAAEIVPVHQRLQDWVQGRLRKRHA
ncbi:hypothetical protein [Terriglobus aquaticus]|uniref:Uncharacterized protein n=1 Tax=Terriglobus aquaticus TaxID=940139 RepID=A0ABW9KJA4_9BACT|nr:hypothetical protein [Terriglobus aquaticus]